MKKAICDVSLALFGGIFLIFLKGYEFNPVLFILLIIVSIVIYLIANRKSESENKEIDSTVLPLPPKPPTGTPK